MSPDPIVITQNGLVRQINHAFTKIFGLNNSEPEKRLDFTTSIQDKDKTLTLKRYKDRMAGKTIPLNMEEDNGNGFDAHDRISRVLAENEWVSAACRKEWVFSREKWISSPVQIRTPKFL